MTDMNSTSESSSLTSGFEQHDWITVSASAAGVLLMLLGVLLPFATLSAAGFSSTAGAFEGFGESAWFLGIPPGVYVLIGVVAVAVSAFMVFAKRGEGPWDGRLYPFLEVLGGAGALFLSLATYLYMEDQAQQATSGSWLAMVGINIDVNPAFGFGVIFLGCACAVVGGTFGFISHGSPQATEAPTIS